MANYRLLYNNRFTFSYDVGLLSMRKGWLRNHSSNTVVIFLHGLMSDSEKCWLNPNGNIYWPDLLIGDARFNGIDIYMASFFTSIDSNDYSIQDCADEVISDLSQTDAQMNKCVLTRKKIIFIGHSTGGIVARYILESRVDLFKDKKIGLALYASPSLGSKMANAVRWISKLTNHKLAKELCWASDILEDLDGRFKELLNQKRLDIVGMECIENKSPFHIPIFNPTNNRVVEKESGGRYFGRPKLIPHSDHSSIVKPTNVESESHKFLWGFIEENGFRYNCSQIMHTETPIISSIKKDVLFEQYSPENECFYIIRDIDGKVGQKLSTNSLWICGPSGVGKTALVQRHLNVSNINSKYISLGPSIGESIEGMLLDVAYELDENLDIDGQPRISQIIKNIEKSIRHLSSEKEFVLFIEEIPITDAGMFKEFSQYIYTLLIALRNVTSFKLILSSIFEPAEFYGTEYEKVSERFEIVPFQRWSEVELNRLIKLIEENTDKANSVNLDGVKFDGSPRQVKIFYRDLDA